MKPIVSSIRTLFETRGDEAYGSEAVTQRQHALQCADLARQDGSDEELVAAALLHDIGHLLGGAVRPEGTGEDLDDAHEERAYRWLLAAFGPRVADPVRLHVAAKRYLCTIEPSYAATLSPTSLKSFLDQGGAMSDDERAAFEAEPHFEEALRLRRWDDRGKDPGAELVPLDDFLPVLDRVATE